MTLRAVFFAALIGVTTGAPAGEPHLAIVGGLGGEAYYTDLFHRWVETLTQVATQRLGMQLEANEQGGFRVEAVRRGSPAQQIGFQRGDLLLALGGRALDGEDALRRAVADLRWRSRVQVVVQRGAGRYHVMLPLG